MKRKRPYFLVLLILLATHSMHAQQDSFAHKVQSYKQQDTTRVELLIDACVNATFSADTTVLSWASEALLLSKKLNYLLGHIRALNCMGNYYYQRSAHEKAIGFYIEALKMAESSNDEKNIIIGKSNLASVYNHIHKQKEAIQLFKECDGLLMKSGDSLTQNRAAVLTNLATSYASINEHDTAAFYYQKVYNICLKKNIVFGIGLSLTNLGSEYLALKKYDQSLNYLLQAETIAEKNALDFLKGAIQKLLGRNYMALNNYPAAIGHLTKAIKIASANSDAENLVESYETLHRAYAATGSYKDAYETGIKFFALKDSLFGIEKEKSIHELSTKYETEKKEQTIDVLTKENKITALENRQKNNIIIGIAALLLITAFVAALLFNRYRIKQDNKLLEEKVHAAEFEKEKTHMELTALKSQMNPHFIFNALNSIQEFIILNDKKKANMFMGKYADLVRTTLNMSDKENVSLEEEIKSLDLYLQLEKLRFEDDFNYEIKIAETIDASMFHLPAMLIQPYVENAIKHGLLHKQGGKKVAIEFAVEADSTLTCTITDNGIGRKRSMELNAMREKRHTSFATGATQKRLELLNHGKQKSIAVSFQDLTDSMGNATGTKVLLHIPSTIQ